MSTDVVCTVVHGGLYPATAAEASKLEDMHGHEVMAKVSKPRNLRYHRKGFALMHAIFGLANTDLTFEVFRKVLVAKAGYGEFIQNGDQLLFVPKSLAWGKMDETEFNRVCNDILTIALRDYGIDEQSVNRLIGFA